MPPQGRTVLRKIVEQWLEQVHWRSRNSTISKSQQRLGPCQIALPELLVNDCIGVGLARQITKNGIQHSKNLWTCRALREPQSMVAGANRKPADDKL